MRYRWFFSCFSSVWFLFSVGIQLELSLQLRGMHSMSKTTRSVLAIVMCTYFDCDAHAGSGTGWGQNNGVWEPGPLWGWRESHLWGGVGRVLQQGLHCVPELVRHSRSPHYHQRHIQTQGEVTRMSYHANSPIIRCCCRDRDLGHCNN